MSASPTVVPDPTVDVVVESVPRNEFALREHLGTAGVIADLGEDPVVDRWRSEAPSWRGKHWSYRPDTDGALRLFPINVARVTRTTS